MTRLLKPTMIIRLILFGLSIMYAGSSSAEASLRIAVASNFAKTLQAIVVRYQEETGDKEKISVSVGSTGKLYAQILAGAPFDLFLAADVERPQKLAQNGVAVGPSQPYTNGRLVLWRPKQRSNLSMERQLKQIERLAMANPQLAPYGLAAEQTLGHLKWQPSNDLTVVTTENVGQVFAMVKTGNADAGFVALSQMLEQGVPKDQFSVVNGNFHDPIYQGAVLLKNGSQPTRAKGFLRFLLSQRPTEVPEAAQDAAPRKADISGQ